MNPAESNNNTERSADEQEGAYSSGTFQPSQLDIPMPPLPRHEEQGSHDPSSNDSFDTIRTEEAWTQCARVMEDHHKGLVKRWKDEIDTLLVYAGLFSAVLTAFNVELYVSLQPNPSDTTNALLLQISAQLNNLALNPSFANSTYPVIPPPSPSDFRATASAVWINALWFSSLICSLSAAFIGMMVKQWLHESEIGLFGTSRNTMRLRQYRIDSLEKWCVGTIVALLPVFLQVASILFLAGLLILLWTLHPVVAGLASALVGALLIFTAMTIIAPSFSEDCAYRSPQSLDVCLLMQGLSTALFLLHDALEQSAWFNDNIPPALRFLLHRPLRLLEFLLYKAPRCSRSPRGFWRTVFHGWARMEHAFVGSREVHFDERTVVAAQLLLLDIDFTSDVSVACALSLPQPHSTWCLYDLVWNLEHHMGGMHFMEHPFGRCGARTANGQEGARNVATWHAQNTSYRPRKSTPSEEYIHLSLALRNLNLGFGYHKSPPYTGESLVLNDAELSQSLSMLDSYGPAAASKLTEEQITTMCWLFNGSMMIPRAPIDGRDPLDDFRKMVFCGLQHLLIYSRQSQFDLAAEGVDWPRILRKGSTATWEVLGALQTIVGEATPSCQLLLKDWVGRDYAVRYVRYVAFLTLIQVLGVSNLQYPSQEAFVHDSCGQYARLQRAVEEYTKSFAESSQLEYIPEHPRFDSLPRTERAVNMLMQLRVQRPSCHSIFEEFEQLITERLRSTVELRQQSPDWTDPRDCVESRLLERLVSQA